MRQAQNKKEKDKVAAALVLAFCVIALTSVFTIKSNIEKINDSNTNLPVSEKVNTSDTESNEAEKTAKAPETAETADTVSAKLPVVDSQNNGGKETSPSKANTSFVIPVKSDDIAVTNEYAMDHLIYSVTLDQYMTHCGIDIEAPEDSQVLAIADGTVTAVYDDDRYGKSIEITHSDNSGLVSVYSNLSTDEMVETGDTVKAGQIISGVGSSGLFESLEPAHLHLELLKDGVYVNPQDYIAF